MKAYVYTVRLERCAELPPHALKTADAVSAYIEAAGLVPDDGREHFGALFLSVRHHVLGQHEVSVGCLTSSLVHPREVFGPALMAKAAAVIVYHNHPSGDPEPSADDVSLTRKLAAAGTLLGVDLLDSLILAHQPKPHPFRFVSLKGRGIV